MIIVGYQGIGKSTLANNNSRYIDLESSNFFVDGERSGNWYKVYCNIAVHLSEQGYNVFMSSHKPVRDELKNHVVDKMIVCPSLGLKDKWISRLTDRYENVPCQNDKNYKALMNAKSMYTENIKDLISEDGFLIKVIDDIDYDLEKVIRG